VIRLTNVINFPKKLAGLAPRRKQAGYTQQDMADALGVERATYAMWEIGKNWPPARLLPSIADILVCSIDDLYKGLPEAAEGEEAV
jgi:transcriptional regulator with XRE-family HTH domain